MSALAEQHQAHVARQARLWKADPPPKPRTLPTVVRFAPRPNWERLFTKPIEALDEHGNVVVAGSYTPQWKRIALEVCAKHGISFNEITSVRRDREVVAARHEAFWRCREETSLSYPQIGRRFGDRDHTTVLYGIRKHQRLLREAANASN